MGATADHARPPADATSLLLPEGSRLVHIGPSKTGTTAVQAAMWAARSQMRVQGVRYAGRARHSEGAAQALAGLKSPFSDAGEPPPIQRWEKLVRSIHRAREPRLILSSELLAHAQPDGIRRLVDDIGPERIRVAVTLRPLPRILASQWQQAVQTGSAVGYEDWLDHLFRPTGGSEARLWYRHRHERLVARWADAVGAERVTAIVVDDRDHAHVLRVFEEMLGLIPGTLQLQEDLANRSLTLPETEAVRAFTIAFREADLPRSLRTTVVRPGIAPQLKMRRPQPGEQRILTPQWALDRAAELACLAVEGIRRSGVHVVGDLDRLTEMPSSGSGTSSGPAVGVSPEVAASMSMGVLVASGLARELISRPADSTGEPSRLWDDAAVARVPSPQIAKSVCTRTVWTTRRRLGSKGAGPRPLGAAPGGDRPLTAAEAEAVREFTDAFHRAGLGESLLDQVRDRGAVPYLRQFDPVGDSTRDQPPSRSDTDAHPAVSVPSHVAAAMAMGVLYACGLARDTTSPGAGAGAWNQAPMVPRHDEPGELIAVPTRDLLGQLTHRLGRSARRRLPGSSAPPPG